MNEISSYSLLQKRLKTSQGIPLDKLEEDKIKTFKIALDRSYNREIVEKEDKKEIKCLISSINTQPIIEKKSFSTLKENNLIVGDILYWPRSGTHWMITDREETEKSIFQGYISQALYELKWLDPVSGVEYNQWACAKGPEETSISDGVKNNIKYDKLNQSLFLWLPKKQGKGLELLDRYFEIFVNGRKWEIQVSDRYSYKDLFTLQLQESLIDEDRDNKEKELVNGKNYPVFTFSCSLDGIKNIKLGQELTLSYFLYKNGKEINFLSPAISLENCVKEGDKIIFNNLGISKIVFNYPSLNKIYEYSINTTDQEIKEDYQNIDGLSVVDTMTTVEYTLNYIQNGEKIIPNGKWEYDKLFLTKIQDSNNNIKFKIRNKIGTTKLSYTFIENGVQKNIDKEIKIVSIYQRG